LPQVLETTHSDQNQDFGEAQRAYERAREIYEQAHDAGAQQHHLRRLADARDAALESWRDAEGQESENPPKYSDYVVPNGDNYRELLLHAPEQAQVPHHQSSHWDTPNVLAHLRMSDRYDPLSPEGDKMLHLEELQSDWGQDERKHQKLEAMRKKRGTKPFADPDEEATFQQMLKRVRAVPHHPYIANTNAWVDLGLKRALREAAKGGYSRLAWTPGAEQADRYGLHKKFKRIAYMTSPGVELGGFNAYFRDRPGGISRNIHEHELPSHIGRELAERLLAAPKEDMGGGDVVRVLEGGDMKTGGEGMEAFYDKLVPTRLKEILKKLGHEAQFEPVTIKHGLSKSHKAGQPVTPENLRTTLHSVRLPDELREKILNEGMPAFQHGGDVERALRLTANPVKNYARVGERFR
jgi:hypothetical protein